MNKICPLSIMSGKLLDCFGERCQWWVEVNNFHAITNSYIGPIYGCAVEMLGLNTEIYTNKEEGEENG